MMMTRVKSNLSRESSVLHCKDLKMRNDKWRRMKQQWDPVRIWKVAKNITSCDGWGWALMWFPKGYLEQNWDCGGLKIQINLDSYDGTQLIQSKMRTWLIEKYFRPWPPWNRPPTSPCCPPSPSSPWQWQTLYSQENHTSKHISFN